MSSKQIRVKALGAAKDLAMRSAFYITLLNFAQISVTAYYTTLRYYLPFNFYVYFALLVVLIMAMMAFEYFVMMPSQIAWLNEQMYKHQNPIVKDLRRIEKRLDHIERILHARQRN
jgi:hypothetical protein